MMMAKIHIINIDDLHRRQTNRIWNLDEQNDATDMKPSLHSPLLSSKPSFRLIRAFFAYEIFTFIYMSANFAKITIADIAGFIP